MEDLCPYCSTIVEFITVGIENDSDLLCVCPECEGGVTMPYELGELDIVWADLDDDEFL